MSNFLYYQIPSFRQFEYWFNKEYKNDEVTILREGKKKFEQNFRAVLGLSTAETEGPGDIYQMIVQCLNK